MIDESKHGCYEPGSIFFFSFARFFLHFGIFFAACVVETRSRAYLDCARALNRADDNVTCEHLAVKNAQNARVTDEQTSEYRRGIVETTSSSSIHRMHDHPLVERRCTRREESPIANERRRKEERGERRRMTSRLLIKYSLRNHFTVGAYERKKLNL